MMTTTLVLTSWAQLATSVRYVSCFLPVFLQWSIEVLQHEEPASNSHFSVNRRQTERSLWTFKIRSLRTFKKCTHHRKMEAWNFLFKWQKDMRTASILFARKTYILLMYLQWSVSTQMKHRKQRDKGNHILLWSCIRNSSKMLGCWKKPKCLMPEKYVTTFLENGCR